MVVGGDLAVDVQVVVVDVQVGVDEIQVVAVDVRVAVDDVQVVVVGVRVGVVETQVVAVDVRVVVDETHVVVDDVQVGVDDVLVVVDDFHAEFEKAKAEVQVEVEARKTGPVSLLAEDNVVPNTAFPSSSDQTGYKSSKTPIVPNPGELVGALVAPLTAPGSTFSCSCCSLTFGSDCSSSPVFCIYSCSSLVVLEEVLRRLVSK